MAVLHYDDVFHLRLLHLANHSGNQAEMHAPGGASEWYAPLAPEQLEAPLPTDVDQWQEAFSRDEINEAYREAVTTEEGTLGDCSALTVQGDYLAMAERAFRLRCASRVRRSAHASARRNGLASPGGAFDRVAGLVQDRLTAGATDQLPPADGPLLTEDGPATVQELAIQELLLRDARLANE
jgi:hypothetical protein